MREWADYTAEADDSGALTLTLQGPLVVSSIGVLDRRLRELTDPIAKVDLSAIKDIDTVGAWTVFRLTRDNDAEVIGASDKAQRLIAAVGAAEGSGDIRPHRAPLLRRVPEELG